jgi:hypothetical protein
MHQLKGTKISIQKGYPKVLFEDVLSALAYLDLKGAS